MSESLTRGGRHSGMGWTEERATSDERRATSDERSLCLKRAETEREAG